MLRHIPLCITWEMLYHLMRMGHGDELVLADGDFPVETISTRVVYAYGLGIPELLEAILPFFSPRSLRGEARGHHGHGRHERAGPERHT